MSFVVYKSSAGSGKTFTLVKEYLKLVLSDEQTPPQKYRHVLAVTFTNKAAAEMKERVIFWSVIIASHLRPLALRAIMRCKLLWIWPLRRVQSKWTAPKIIVVVVAGNIVGIRQLLSMMFMDILHILMTAQGKSLLRGLVWHHPMIFISVIVLRI